MRRLIRNSSVLYPPYVRYILRNASVSFPSAETDLHLTGFPRSANTYCHNIAKVAFPNLDFCTHIHTTASLKLALKYSVLTIVLVRDPVSTCCSLLLKHRDEFRIFVRTVGEFLAIKMSEDEVRSKAEAGQRLIESKEAHKTEEGSSLPNAKRKEMRKLVEPAVVEHPLCEPASELFSALVPNE